MKRNKIYLGNALSILQSFPAESIDCCITSPPYWGLRDYGTAKWEGGEVNCDHTINHYSDTLKPNCPRPFRGDKSLCIKCGAKRIDAQLGLEKTPEEYVSKMVEVFREVKRVLKKEGTLWLNLGDSYASQPSGSRKKGDLSYFNEEAEGIGRPNKIVKGLKPKDLVGIPWRIAFALQADGWYLRQDIIWSKPNPMPESVTDRCTKSHEYVFLLAKSPKYFFDNEAIKEPYTQPMNRWGGQKLKADGKSTWDKGTGQSTYRERDMRPNPNGRNKRSVWIITTKPNPIRGVHFATFPEDLIRPMILAGCPERGIILDPFIGSGTTAVVAQKLGRDYLGIELNPDYIKMAEKRLVQSILL